jgi:hypothetical protein
MKGAFETALVMLFGMMFLLMGMDYVRLILYNNRARLVAENALAIIEHQNRYDQQVELLVRDTLIQCSVCQLEVQVHDQYPERKWIIVTYPLNLPHLNLVKQSQIRLLTRPLN